MESEATMHEASTILLESLPILLRMRRAGGRLLTSNLLLEEFVDISDRRTVQS